MARANARKKRALHREDSGEETDAKIVSEEPASPSVGAGCIDAAPAGVLVRRVYAKGRGAAEAFFGEQRAWVEDVLRELGAESFGERLLRRAQSSFVRMAVRGLDGGKQTVGQLRWTIRSICEIQFEGLRLERGGFFKAYARKDLDAAKEIFNGLYRVLRDGMVRKIRHNKAGEGEEEILQRVFFALWKNLSQFGLGASYRSMVDWVHTVLANQTAQWWREQRDRALGEGTVRRMTRAILPDDAEFDWNDPDLVNAWLAGPVAETARSVEERYLQEAEDRDAGEAKMGAEVDGSMDGYDLEPTGGCEAEGNAYAGDQGTESNADKGFDVDEANGLGPGSYAASLQAAEAWRRGAGMMLEQPIEAVLAPLKALVGPDVLSRATESIKRLQVEQQNAFKAWLILRVVGSSSGEEIAAFLGVNYSTFRGWLRKARRAVAEALGQRAPLADGDDGEGEAPTSGRPGDGLSNPDA